MIMKLLGKAAFSLVGSILTEMFFKRMLARVTVAILEYLASLSKTNIDDKAIIPLVSDLKKEF